MIERRKTNQVSCGTVGIGSNSDISIQSMTNTKTDQINETVEQIRKLNEAGCEIVRVAVPDMKAAKAIKEIKSKIKIPLVADIHFNHTLALEAIENGIDKLRLNPGNLNDPRKTKEVVEACKLKGIPIRIGVNGGSLDPEVLEKYGRPSADALVESALNHVKLLETNNFTDIVISIKSSDVNTSFKAYSQLAKLVTYPLHLGITEAGTEKMGTVKSAIGIGSLLLGGIGDTIRVSLTEDPVREIDACKNILSALGIRNFGIEFISCPTCGRCQNDLINITKLIEHEFGNIKKHIKVAVMGCAVNGPGEAKEADLGVAGGNGEALIFKKGVIVKKVKEQDIIKALYEEIEKL